MRLGRLAGIPQGIARIVMGTVRAEPELWERYVEAGGNCFDTARHYGDESEDMLGRFLERRGTREEVVLVGKVAHTPDCRPEAVRPQLERSLELLRTDRVDMLLLHRDDPAVPVREFVDALDAEVTAGRAGAAGLSNWSAERFEAFDRDAAERGRTRPGVLSNQLSLAEMLEPVWAGCQRADPAWHERTQTPLLAWSAQARGFFAGRKEDEELRRSWLSPANLERRARAGQVAARLGVAPAAVALAWLLALPFPTWAVVGPRNCSELDACLRGGELELEPADLDRLAAR